MACLNCGTAIDVLFYCGAAEVEEGAPKFWVVLYGPDKNYQIQTKLKIRMCHHYSCILIKGKSN